MSNKIKDLIDKNKLNRKHIDKWKKNNDINSDIMFNNFSNILSDNNYFIYMSPLQYAYFTNNLSCAKFLIKNGAKLYYQNCYGDNILHLLCKYKFSNYNIIKHLLNKNINIWIKNNKNRIAISYLKPNIKGIKLFLQSKQYSNKIKKLKKKY